MMSYFEEVPKNTTVLRKQSTHALLTTSSENLSLVYSCLDQRHHCFFVMLFWH